MIETIQPSPFCALLPADDCRAIIASGERALAKPQPEDAAALARTLIGVYPRADVIDPDAYATAVAGTLAEFPLHIARKVASPITGVPARQKFLPRIAEIREACEAELTRQKTIVARARWMLDERERRDKQAEADRALRDEQARVSPERIEEILRGVAKTNAA